MPRQNDPSAARENSYNLWPLLFNRAVDDVDTLFKRTRTLFGDSMYFEQGRIDTFSFDVATGDSLYAIYGEIDTLWVNQATFDSLYSSWGVIDTLSCDSFYTSKAVIDTQTSTLITSDSIHARVVTVDSAWEDLKFPFTQARRGANLKPDFDTANVGLLFPQNNTDERIYMIVQLPHAWLAGSNLEAHVHWIMDTLAFPVWEMHYKWTNMDGEEAAGFDTLTGDTALFGYTSGNKHQLTKLGSIDATGKTLSSILVIKFFRNDNIVTGDIRALEFDLHYKVGRLGSTNELY